MIGRYARDKLPVNVHAKSRTADVVLNKQHNSNNAASDGMERFNFMMNTV